MFSHSTYLFSPYFCSNKIIPKVKINTPKTNPPTKAINCDRNKDNKKLNPNTNPIPTAPIIIATKNTMQVILNTSFKLSPPNEKFHSLLFMSHSLINPDEHIQQLSYFQPQKCSYLFQNICNFYLYSKLRLPLYNFLHMNQEPNLLDWCRS